MNTAQCWRLLSQFFFFFARALSVFRCCIHPHCAVIARIRMCVCSVFACVTSPTHVPPKQEEGRQTVFFTTHEPTTKG